MDQAPLATKVHANTLGPVGLAALTAFAFEPNTGNVPPKQTRSEL